MAMQTRLAHRCSDSVEARRLTGAYSRGASVKDVRFPVPALGSVAP